jgi:hypothetical protein
MFFGLIAKLFPRRSRLSGRPFGPDDYDWDGRFYGSFSLKWYAVHLPF